MKFLFDTDHISAEYQNGVLSVTLPKKSTSQSADGGGLVGLAGPQRSEGAADVVSVRAQRQVREMEAPEVGHRFGVVLCCGVVVQIGCHVPLPGCPC